MKFTTYYYFLYVFFSKLNISIEFHRKKTLTTNTHSNGAKMKIISLILILITSLSNHAFEKKIEMRDLEGITEDGQYCEVSYTLEDDNGILKTTRIKFTVQETTIIDEYVHDKRWTTPGIQVYEGLFSTQLWKMGESQLGNAYQINLYGSMTNPSSVKLEVRSPIIDRDRFFLFPNKENSYIQICHFD
jgi:hypothetical protein